jgi:NAD dependent epimerase/dehydratase family enzyme
MVMSPDPASVFDVLSGMVRRGLGGSIAGGRQWISWIHDRDFTRAIDFLIAREDLSGAVNLAAPEPLPQREFMAALRAAWGVPLGLPATRWMAAVGAFFLRTDPELVFKSRRVVPGRLQGAGFIFEHPSWPEAARDLVARHSSS